MIEHHFGNQPWCGIRLSYSQETQPLGTAGALRVAASLVKSQRILVVNGDTYCRYDSRRLLDVHLHNSATATLWLSRVNDPSRFGGVAVDAQGCIQGFREKESADGRQLASAGVYLLERDLRASIQPGRAVSLEFEVFPSLVGRGLFGVIGEGPFVDIGTPESLNGADITLSGELDRLDCD
jgi:NDP-sugar pyrophosphorylase family protein